jgi:hypothetical protein
MKHVTNTHETQDGNVYENHSHLSSGGLQFITCDSNKVLSLLAMKTTSYTYIMPPKMLEFLIQVRQIYQLPYARLFTSASPHKP